jgi:prepilin-type N-terminal cleavage/methylation domain-containing protein
MVTDPRVGDWAGFIGGRALGLRARGRLLRTRADSSYVSKHSRPIRRKLLYGLSLTEVIVVLAIIAIVAALLFPIVRSSNRQGLQAKTTANLKQIYAAMVLYSQDHGVSDELPGLGLVPLALLPGSTQLFAYGLDPDQLHSAAFPESGRWRWGSSFTWSWLRDPSGGTGHPASLQQIAEQRRLLASQGSSFVIVSDRVHDYFEYWPHERTTDVLMQRQFQINLRVSGSVKRERRPGQRGHVVPYWLKKP